MFLEEVKARSNEVCGEPLGLGFRGGVQVSKRLQVKVLVMAI